MASFPISINFTKVPPSEPKAVGLLSSSRIHSTKSCDQTTNIVRRSGNYEPTIWDHAFVESLTSHYVGESCTRRIKELKEEVRMFLEQAEDHVEQLELIDTLQRLGLAYHFEQEINRLLKSIYDNDGGLEDRLKNRDLYATALEFRLLRQHGYRVHQKVFSRFRDEQGNFKVSLSDDVKGMLYLYEASYYLVEGESMLEDARDFTAKNLQNYVEDEYLSMLVNHALEMPLHWRTPRVEAYWFIKAYEKKGDMNPIFLELAKLDFNMVQATHQKELKQCSRWWKNTCLGEKMYFARDRLVECFFWALGMIYEPQFGYFRKVTARTGSLVTVIDDIYDVYSTLSELELFTDAVVRWDINAMDELPYHMRLCFLALYNSTNEMAYDILKEQGNHIIPHLKKAWADLCKCYLVEAKWYHSEYTPTLQEYLDQAWISVAGPLLLVHTYFLLTNPIDEEDSPCLEEYSNIIQCSSMILRLANDLGTSSDEIKRGDNSKSIQCYMYETSATEEEARTHIQYLIYEAWKKMNEYGIANPHFSKTFVGAVLNIARIAQCIYQYGDGHGSPHGQTTDHVISLLVQPFVV